MKTNHSIDTGIIEGFFGRPWSFEERESILRFMDEVGFSTYIYGPKEDAYHRTAWFDAYPPDTIRWFEKLIELSRELSIDFNFALSPGLTMRYSDAAHFQKLTAKYDQFINLGVTSFSIFFDDIDPGLSAPDRTAFGVPAVAQVDVTKRLHEYLKDRCPNAKLYFCPTEYRGTRSSPYLDHIGTHLPLEIKVFWTGPRVVSRTITPRDARQFSRIIRRKPLLWDNYPVNDFDRSRLFLGPLRGRHQNLIPQLSGIFFNPMNEAHASKIALTSAALYVRSPGVYNPKRLWPLLKKTFTKSNHADLAFDDFEASMIHPRPSARCRLVKNQLLRLRHHKKIQRGPLLAMARAIRQIHSADFVPGVAADLGPYLKNLKTAGRLLTAALSTKPDRREIQRLESKLKVSRRKEARNYLENHVLDLVRRLLRGP